MSPLSVIEITKVRALPTVFRFLRYNSRTIFKGIQRSPQCGGNSLPSYEIEYRNDITPEKRFRQMIKQLVQHDHLPDYNVGFDEAEDMIIFINRGTMVPAPLIEGNVPPLKPDTHECARHVAPGWDIHYLEREWRDWIFEPPRDADGAFIGFCRKWFEKRGRP